MSELRGDIPQELVAWPPEAVAAAEVPELDIVPGQTARQAEQHLDENPIVAGAGRRGRAAVGGTVEVDEASAPVDEKPDQPADQTGPVSYAVVPENSLYFDTTTPWDRQVTSPWDVDSAEGKTLTAEPLPQEGSALSTARTVMHDVAPTESRDDPAPVRKIGLGGEGYQEPPGKPPAFGLPALLALGEKFNVSSVVASEAPGCVQTPGWYRVHFTCGGGSGWTYINAESPEAAQQKLAGPGNFLTKWSAAQQLRFPEGKEPKKPSLP